MQTQQQLRKQIKAKRKQLSPLQQSLASARLCKQLKHSRLPSHTTSYIASQGELNPHSVNRYLLQRGVAVYVPVVKPNFQLAFVPWKPFTQQIPNQYGIKEPRFSPQRTVAKPLLEAVMIPLVGFDHCGHRIGMGGGYYDRWLASFRRINVIGVAHNCQQVPRIRHNKWDKALNAVVTPRFTQHFKPPR